MIELVAPIQEQQDETKNFIDQTSESSSENNNTCPTMHESNRLLHTIDEEDEGPGPGRRDRTSLWVTLAILAALVVSVDLFFLNNKEESKVIQVELEGKKVSSSKHDKKSSKSSSKSSGEDGDLSSCNDGKYSKRTLQLAYELPFHALFRNNTRRKFEASSVIVHDGYGYAICDASWAVRRCS